MKIKLSMILSAVLFCIVSYGIFVFAGNLFGLNENNSGLIKISGRIEGIEYHAAAKVAGKVTNFSIEGGKAGKKVQKFYRCEPFFSP
jgi:hypothetical protein